MGEPCLAEMAWCYFSAPVNLIDSFVNKPTCIIRGENRMPQWARFNAQAGSLQGRMSISGVPQFWPLLFRIFILKKLVFHFKWSHMWAKPLSFKCLADPKCVCVCVNVCSRSSFSFTFGFPLTGTVLLVAWAAWFTTQTLGISESNFFFPCLWRWILSFPGNAVLGFGSSVIWWNP